MAVPQYPESRDITLADKPFLDDLFGRLRPRVSEFTFANIFLFRAPHAYRLTMVGDAPVLLGAGYDGAPYFLPPLSGDVAGALARLFGEGKTLYGADEAFCERYLGDPALLVTEDRDSFDYLYLRSDLAELPGNRFHKKKNRIAYFARRHPAEAALYGERYREGALRLLDEWYHVRSAEGSGTILSEVAATREALALAGPLGLEGVVVTVGGEVKAFALGERLNGETAVCHFEKADPFMEGVSQLVNREFSRLLFTDCTYVNREQDLGEAGLRDAKLSYHPVELVRKYRARLSG